VLEKKKKWALIAKLISGRTENSVKNRFSSLMSRQNRQPPGFEEVSDAKEIDLIKQLIKEKQQEISQKNTEVEEKSPQVQEQNHMDASPNPIRTDELALEELLRLNSRTKELLMNQAQTLINQSTSSEQRISASPLQLNYFMEPARVAQSAQNPLILPSGVYHHSLITPAQPMLAQGPLATGFYPTNPYLYYASGWSELRFLTNDKVSSTVSIDNAFGRAKQP
jgi:hypothetical protein